MNILRHGMVVRRGVQTSIRVGDEGRELRVYYDGDDYVSRQPHVVEHFNARYKDSLKDHRRILEELLEAGFVFVPRGPSKPPPPATDSGRDLFNQFDDIFRDKKRNEAVSRKLIERVLQERPLDEFEEDLKKQMIILVGAPASGKSYFVKNSFLPWAKNATLGKSFPGILDLHFAAGVESDNSLRRMQFETAQKDFSTLEQAEAPDEFFRLLQDDRFSYESDGGQQWLRDSLTWDEFRGAVDTARTDPFGSFFRLARVREYYASMRGVGVGNEMLKDQARELFFDATRHALTHAGHAIIIDSAGEDISKTPFNDFLMMAVHEDFSPTLVELSIPLELSIQRNELRGKKGRAVPVEEVVSAYNAMRQVVNRLRKDPRFDRYVKYAWKATGEGPFAGHFVVDIDDRTRLKRRLDALRRGDRLVASRDRTSGSPVLAESPRDRIEQILRKK